MFPTAFEQSNTVLGPPEGVPEAMESLAVCKGVNEHGPVVLSCWKLTQRELDEINKTKRVWLHVQGESMQPVWLSGSLPKIETNKDGT